MKTNILFILYLASSSLANYDEKCKNLDTKSLGKINVLLRRTKDAGILDDDEMDDISRDQKNKAKMEKEDKAKDQKDKSKDEDKAKDSKDKDLKDDKNKADKPKDQKDLKDNNSSKSSKSSSSDSSASGFSYYSGLVLLSLI